MELMGQTVHLEGYLFDLFVELVKFSGWGLIAVGSPEIDSLCKHGGECQLLTDVVMQLAGNAASLLFLRMDQALAELAHRAFGSARSGKIKPLAGRPVVAVAVWWRDNAAAEFFEPDRAAEGEVGYVGELTIWLLMLRDLPTANPYTETLTFVDQTLKG